MVVEDDELETPRTNLLAEVLMKVRQRYREEPPEPFMKRARSEAVRRFAKERRDSHRENYDALAEE